MLSLVVLLMLLKSEPSQLPDSRNLSSAERIAVANKLADSRRGPDAADSYRVAFEKARYPFEVLDQNVAIGAPAPSRWLDENEIAITLRLDWPADKADLIRRWLASNAEALDAVRAACVNDRCVLPFTLDCPFDAQGIEPLAKLRRMAKMLAASAAWQAHEGHWPEAYTEALRILRIGAHVRQRPTSISQMVGNAIERLSLQELAAFLTAHEPRSLDEIGTALKLNATLGADDEAIEWVENAANWDLIDVTHAWARDEATCPSMRALLELWIEPKEDMKEISKIIAPATQPYKRIDDFKRAVAATTLAQSGGVLEQLNAQYSIWSKLRLDAGLKSLSKMRAEQSEIASRDPIFALWSGSSLFPPGKSRIVGSEHRMHRDALLVILSLVSERAKSGGLPQRLADLPAELQPRLLDVYSGEPLRYVRSADGSSFRLYSVGENQQDDGGDLQKDVVFWPFHAPEFETPKY